MQDQAIVDGHVSSIVESGHLYLQLNVNIVTSIEEILKYHIFFPKCSKFFDKTSDSIIEMNFFKF